MSQEKALELLQAIGGFSATQNASQPIKLAVVDPTYTASTYPGTLPKVTFDGESSLSTKRYPAMSPYLPVASDRVVMLPIGGTYLIAGALDTDASVRVGGDLSVTGVSTLAAPAYTNATLQNSWAVWGGGFATPGYKRLPGGLVKLQGLAGGGSKTSDTIFTLPAGYRPAAILLFATIATDAFGAVKVASDGAVVRYAGTATWVSLDTVVFPAEA